MIRGDRLPRDNLLMVPKREIIGNDLTMDENVQPILPLNLHTRYQDLVSGTLAESINVTCFCCPK